jgi:integrase
VRILYKRALTHGASDPDHFLLPADLSKHVSEKDPLRGKSGFDVTRHQQSWRTAWRNLRDTAGLAGVRFHDLRHTFITHLAENNIALPVVRSMVGHMTQSVTDRYTPSAPTRHVLPCNCSKRFIRKPTLWILLWMPSSVHEVRC